MHTTPNIAATTDPLRAHRDKARTPGVRVALAGALLVFLPMLAACSTDQVFDTSRYWGDRITGATISGDPSKD